MSSPRKMAIMQAVDMLIQLIPSILALVMFLASICEIVIGGVLSYTVFAWPFIGVLSVRSITVIIYTSFYLYTFYHLDYLLPHVRVVTTFAFIMLGMAFTSLTFSTTLPLIIIYACMLFITGVILWYYNRQNSFFAFPFTLVVLIVYYILLLMVLNKLHGHVSSSTHSVVGFLAQSTIRFVGVWLWGDAYIKRGGFS